MLSLFPDFFLTGRPFISTAMWQHFVWEQKIDKCLQYHSALYSYTEIVCSLIKRNTAVTQLPFFCVCLPQYVSELRFDGFSLRSPVHQISGSSLLQAPPTTADHKLQSEVSPELFKIFNLYFIFCGWLVDFFFYQFYSHLTKISLVRKLYFAISYDEICSMLRLWLKLYFWRQILFVFWWVLLFVIKTFLSRFKQKKGK